MEWLDKETEEVLAEFVEKYADNSAEFKINKLDGDKKVIEKLITFGCLKSTNGIVNDESGHWHCFATVSDLGKKYFELKEQEESRGMNEWEIFLKKLIRLADNKTKRVYQYTPVKNERDLLNILKEKGYVKDTKAYGGSVALTITFEGVNHIKDVGGEELITKDEFDNKPKENANANAEPFEQTNYMLFRLNPQEYYKNVVLALEAVKMNLAYAGLDPSVEKLVSDDIEEVKNYVKKNDSTAIKVLLNEINDTLKENEADTMCSFIANLILE